MELRQLRYFVAVAEDLNFTRAAARLHIAQPPLSVQIRKLETEIGAELFTRAAGGDIALTPAGQVFLVECRHTLAQADRGAKLAREASRGSVGHLSIGHVRSAEFLVLPRAVTTFRAEHPGVEFEFWSMPSDQQIDLVARGALDVGFVWMPVGRDDLEVAPLKEENLMVVLPEGHPLAARSEVGVADIADEALVLFRRSIAPAAFQAIASEFDRVGAAMNIAFEVGSMYSVINFVAEGGGIGVLPDFASQVRRDGVVFRRLTGLATPYTLAIVKRRGPVGPADRFFAHTVRTIAG
jgi:DNA-binding transcriptional LysR family regulator